MPDHTVAPCPPRLVGFEVQSSLLAQRYANVVPVEARLPCDVVQREHHAFFHGLQATDEKEGVRVVEERREVGRAFAHEILHITAGQACRAREREVDIDEVFGQALQRPEVGQFFARACAEK